MGGREDIGIVGAGGWLGAAFAQAIVEAGIVDASRLTLSYRSRKPDLLAKAHWTSDNQELFDRAGTVIISVRPEDFPSVKAQTRSKLIISVMAGITVDQLSQRFLTNRVIRTLPNAAAEVRKSYTPWVASEGVSAEDKTLARRILESCGTADEVPSESDIDYLTGLTGSGPAFPALLAKAMMDDAIRRGFDPQIAQRSVNAILVGAGRLFERHGESPGDVVETFMNYRGTTAAAIDAMRMAGFEKSVQDGLAAALQKSVSMGKAS